MPWDGKGRPFWYGGRREIHGGSSNGHNIYLPAGAGQGIGLNDPCCPICSSGSVRPLPSRPVTGDGAVSTCSPDPIEDYCPTSADISTPTPCPSIEPA